MGLRTQKYWLEPKKIDAAADLATKLTPNPAGLIISTLPTTNPEVAGALWVNNNVVTVSTG